MADYRCERCQWGVPYVAGMLHCRKNPPVFRDGFSGDRGYWPCVFRDDWCGQFSPKRQEPWTATVEEPRGPE